MPGETYSWASLEPVRGCATKKPKLPVKQKTRLFVL